MSVQYNARVEIKTVIPFNNSIPECEKYLGFKQYFIWISPVKLVLLWEKSSYRYTRKMWISLTKVFNWNSVFFKEFSAGM